MECESQSWSIAESPTWHAGPSWEQQLQQFGIGGSKCSLALVVLQWKLSERAANAIHHCQLIQVFCQEVSSCPFWLSTFQSLVCSSQAVSQQVAGSFWSWRQDPNQWSYVSHWRHYSTGECSAVITISIISIYLVCCQHHMTWDAPIEMGLATTMTSRFRQRSHNRIMTQCSALELQFSMMSCAYEPGRFEAPALQQ